MPTEPSAKARPSAACTISRFDTDLARLHAAAFDAGTAYATGRLTPPGGDALYVHPACTHDDVASAVVALQDPPPHPFLNGRYHAN